MIVARLAAAALLAGLGPTAALAHAHLVSSVPAPGASGPAPDAVVMHFSEGLEPALSGAALTGPGGAAVPAGPARLAPGDAKTLIVPLGRPLAPGGYRVDWHAVAADGHKTAGAFRFSVAP